MQKDYQKTFRIFSSFLLTLFVVISISGFSLPQAAYASDLDSPVQVSKDIFNSISTHATALTSAVTANATVATQVKGYVLDPLAWFVAKAAIQSIVNSTVRWINSGFHGSPAFATNLAQTLQTVGDTAANSFLSQLASNGAIRSPFQNQVASAVSQNYFSSTAAGGFFNQNPYTLNKVTSNDAAFLAGNFSSGGWDAWLSTSMHSANNPYGATILAKAALANQVTSAQNNQKTELGWGQGFLSWRGNCASSGSAPASSQPLGVSSNGGPIIGLPNGTTLNGSAGASAPVTTVPGTINPNQQLTTSVPQLGAAVILNSQTITLSPSAPVVNVTPVTPVTATNYGAGNIVSPTINPNQQLNSSLPSLASNDNCLGSNIQTPGSVIMAGLNKSLGSGIDTLVNANQFNEIVNALLGQLMNQVLGPNGLGGLTQPSAANGGAPYLNASSTAAQTTSAGTSLTAGFTQTLTTQAASLQTFQSQWNIIGAAAQNARTALLASTCTPNAPAIVATTVQPVIDQAISELSQSNTALASISKIQNELTASAGATDSTTQLTQASTDYSTFISSGQLPSASDITDAATQSTDTGTSTPPSLYTQMTQLQTAAQSCAVPAPPSQ